MQVYNRFLKTIAFCGISAVISTPAFANMSDFENEDITGAVQKPVADAKSGQNLLSATPTLGVYTPKFTLGATVGTLGVGVEAGYRFHKHFGVRAAVNGGAFNTNFKVNRNSYSADASMLTFGPKLDFYPFIDSGFRISIGALANYNKIKLRTMPARPLVVGATTLQPSEFGPLKGDASYANLIPFAAIGYEGEAFNNPNFVIGAEVGVAYQDTVDLKNIRSEGTRAAELPTIPGVQAKLDNETRDLIKALNRLSAIPVIAVSAKYKF